ncbi:hypothetical protein ACFQ4A_08800 [Lentibacillus salinarum]|uniref:Uncharacterized protein n=1 Tax=Lentibacillus salinarum TaxID=446820 RepID=A0ABW3ZUJ8_9BACI
MTKNKRPDLLQVVIAMASEDNLRYLQRTGEHYIVGEKMPSGKPEIKGDVITPII